MPAKQSASIFCRRLREARMRLGIAQDKLGVMIGLDEGCASARMSRYESGIHEPPVATAKLIAEALNVPLPYFYCEEDDMAEILLLISAMPQEKRQQLRDAALQLAPD